MRILSKILTAFIVLSLFLIPCYAKKNEMKGKGYKGTLPDLSRIFRYKQTQVDSQVGDNVVVKPVTPDLLQKGPQDDAVFVDVIINKKKTSKYTEDLLRIIPVAEKLRNITKNESDIQKFNAGVNVFDLYVSKLKKDYEDKPESISESYQMLQDVNYRAKVLGNLKYEANYYSMYKPVLEKEYTPEYIKEHNEILVKELDKTIFILQNECDNTQFGNNQ